MFTEEHCHYTVLTRPNSNSERPKWHIDKKVAIFVIILMFPLLLFCICYMTIYGFSSQLIYPKKLTKGNIEQNIHRAKLYSLISKNISFNIDFVPVEVKTVTNHKLVCYYNFPDDASSLQVGSIDPFLCTHINAAFADVVNNTIFLSETRQKILKDLVNLKLINKQLKIFISIGGAGKDEGYPKMVLNHNNRKSFIKSILDYVKNFKIDGVDLDWEFPNANNSIDSRQKIHFTQLLEEIRHTIDRQSHHKFLLSVAVAAPFAMVESYYDVSYMDKFVDFINLMSYDFHFYTKTTPYTGLNSPLYASDNELYFLSTLNVNFSSYFWTSLGMKREKIIIGLATFGHSFRLANPNNNNTYAPALGYGRLGTVGFASYPEICSFLLTNQITPIFDMETRSPYASKYFEWVSFDNVESLVYKTDFILNNGFGGAMVYSLNCDDYNGICENGNNFPLIRSIKNVLQKNN